MKAHSVKNVYIDSYEIKLIYILDRKGKFEIIYIMSDLGMLSRTSGFWCP